MEEKTLYLPTEHNDRIIAFIGSPLGLLAAWLVLINTVTFLIFGVDKLLAKHPRFRQRVPEKICCFWPWWAAAWVPCWGCTSSATRRSTGSFGWACR